MFWLTRFYAERTTYILSPEIAKTFLQTPSNYTPKNIQQISTALEILKNEIHAPNLSKSKTKLFPADVEDTLNEYQSRMLTLVNKTSQSQVVSLFKSMSILKLGDQRLWTLFENHIMRNFTTFESAELTKLIEACAFASRDSDFLWDWFEEKIVQFIGNGGKINISDLYVIIKSFASQKKGSKNLFRILNDKIVEDIDQMNGKEYAATINSFTRTRNIDKDVVATMLSSYDKFRSKIMGNGISTILAFFLRNNMPKHKIEEIEDHFIENLEQMNMASLSVVSQVYGEKFAGCSGGRVEGFLNKIEDYFFAHEKQLTMNMIPERRNELLLTFFWGIEKVRPLKDRRMALELMRDRDFRKKPHRNNMKLMIEFLDQRFRGSI